MKKLGIFISHPVHYQVPWYRMLRQRGAVEPRVYFYSDSGARRYFDPQFGKEVVLATGLLDGYWFRVLKNLRLQKGFRFFSFVNCGIGTIMRRERFKAVLLSSWAYMSDWLVVFSALFTKTPVFLRAENPYNQEATKPAWKKWAKRTVLGRILFPRIAAFLYIGQENKKFYRYYGVPDKKLVFAPYCVDNDTFQQAYQTLAPQKQVLRAKLGIPASAVVILSLGSKLSPKKRPLDLLRAFERMSAKDKYLVFLGDGVLRSQLEQRIRQQGIRNVLLAGFQDQTKIPEFYAIADMAVMPSGEGETWGLMVNEAMNFKLPIIVSDVAGCARDLVGHGSNGFIFPTGDIEKLSGFMDELALDKAKREAFGNASFALIQHYTYQVVVDAVHKAFDRIV